jgi:hypothetical protein
MQKERSQPMPSLRPPDRKFAVAVLVLLPVVASTWPHLALDARRADGQCPRSFAGVRSHHSGRVAV